MVLIMIYKPPQRNTCLNNIFNAKFSLLKLHSVPEQIKFSRLYCIKSVILFLFIALMILLSAWIKDHCYSITKIKHLCKFIRVVLKLLNIEIDWCKHNYVFNYLLKFFTYPLYRTGRSSVIRAVSVWTEMVYHNKTNDSWHALFLKHIKELSWYTLILKSPMIENIFA